MELEEILENTTEIGSETIQDIDDLLESYDLQPPDYNEETKIESVSFEDRQAELSEMENAEECDQRPAHTDVQLAEQMDFKETSSIELDEEIGTPGTRMWDGKIRQETTGKYRPYNMRGRLGNPGLLEDQYRQETVIRSSVDSIVEIQKSAERRIKPPKSKFFSDENLYEEVVDWCQDMNAVFHNLESNVPGVSGLQEYISDAAEAVALFGFAPSEVVWAEREGLDVDEKVPKKIAFREPSTVERWVMDAKLSRLLAIDFKTNASSETDIPQYSLPVRGPNVSDRKAILARISGRGTNWEGVAPARSAEHWIKFKQLLGQIVAATAQKYGVPTTYIRLDPSFFEAMPTPADADQSDIKALVDKLDAKEAIECAIVGLPGGLMAETEGPEGTMPKFEDLIRYCDEQIAKCYNNEGSLLSGNQLGSYAMAEVAENRFLRSAPKYSDAIMQPLNGLLRGMARRRFGMLPRYPTFSTTFSALQDTQAFIRNLDTLFAPNTSIPDWPEDVRREVEHRMDLPEGTFDEGPNDMDRRPGEQGAAPRPRNRRGTGELSEQQVDGHQVNEPHRHNYPPADEPRGPDPQPGIELQEIPTNFDAERAENLLEEAEKEAIDEIRRLLEQQTEAFQGRASRSGSPDRIRSISQDLRDVYVDRLERPIRQLAIREASAGAEHLAEEFGVEVEGFELQERPIADELEAPLFDNLDWLDSRNRPRVQGAINHLADELASRNVGKNRQDAIDALGVDEDPDLEPLEKAAIALVVERLAGEAYTAGRDQLTRDAQQKMAGRTIETDDGEEVQVQESDFKAARSSMMDSNVCGPCRDLDERNGGPVFEVGTTAYFAHKPPKKCVTNLGSKPRCRCIYLEWDEYGGDAMREGIEAVLIG